MGTDKRERQKANRAQRQREMEHAASRRRWTRIAVIVGGALVAVVGLVVIANLATGDDEPSTTPETVAVQDDPAATEGSGDTVAAGDAGAAASDAGVETVPDGCPPPEGTAEQTQTFDAAPPSCLDPTVDYAATVTTSTGEFTIDLDQEQAPTAVNNFVFLARNRYFDDTTCHRIIPGFVVQCGDPTGTGTGGPGYEFADELPDAGSYEIGSVAMANSGADTNGSQFFVITGEQGTSLPPQYSLFGAVAEGFDTTVVEMEAAGTDEGTPSETVTIESVDITTS